MQRKLVLLVILGSIFMIIAACSAVTGAATPTPDATRISEIMQATVDMLQSTITAAEANGKATADAWMTQVAATGQPQEPPAQQVPTEELLPGSVSGQLSYPSEMIPALRLVLWNVEDGTYLTMEVPQDTFEYRWEDVPAGHYQLVAYLRNADTGGFAGGYSKAVPCGLSVDCNDHSLIVFEVRPGEETSGINPGDWYAPAGAFPADPTR
mgnify:FL=1